jgi:hypothetical protein
MASAPYHSSGLISHDQFSYVRGILWRICPSCSWVSTFLILIFYQTYRRYGETSCRWGGVFQALCDYFYNKHQGLIALSSVREERFFIAAFLALWLCCFCGRGQQTTHRGWGFSHGCLDVLGMAILTSATCFMLYIIIYINQQPSCGPFLFQASFDNRGLYKQSRFNNIIIASPLGTPISIFTNNNRVLSWRVGFFCISGTNS